MAFQKHCMHVLVECQNCDWDSGDYATGQAAARAHVRATGHTVRGEVGYAVTYGPSRDTVDITAPHCPREAP